MIELNREKAIYHYTEYMKALGLDLSDPNTEGTPKRVVKMMEDDIFSGLYKDLNNITAFPNLENYSGIVFQGDIEVKSICSHHHLPITGKAYVAYIPTEEGKIIGLSKLNRIVDHFCRRPQIQENLTSQIHDKLADTLGDTLGVAVYIKANHACVSMRGIKHNSTMSTSKFSGVFLDNANKARNEFYYHIGGIN